MLDIIEHLRSPEAFLTKLRDHCRSLEFPVVIITTGNIAFAPLRLGLMLGQFNYGTRGILDFSHTRLFTARTLRTMLQGAGYDIIEERGIPAPWPLALGHGWASKTLLVLQEALIRISYRLFAYQLAVVCRPKPTLHQLLADAEAASHHRRQEMSTEYQIPTETTASTVNTSDIAPKPSERTSPTTRLGWSFWLSLLTMVTILISARVNVFTHTAKGQLVSENLSLFMNTLRDHLGEYLWFSTHKPPLTYLLHAVVVRLFDNQTIHDHNIFLILVYGWDILAAMCLYRAATLLGCSSILSAIVITIQSLAFISLEQWWGGFHYDHHTQFFTALFVLMASTFLTRPTKRWSVAALSVSAALLVAQSTVNAAVMVMTVTAMLVAVAIRDQWSFRVTTRRLIAGLVAPLLMLGGLVFKNYLVASVPATSNLGGMATIMVVSQAGYLTVDQLRQHVVDANVPSWYLWCFDNATSPLDPNGVPYTGWELHARESGICYPWTEMNSNQWPHDFRPLRDHLSKTGETTLATIVDKDIADSMKRRYLFSGYSPNSSARWIAQYGAVSLQVYRHFVFNHPVAYLKVVRQLNQAFLAGASYPELLKGPDDAFRVEMAHMKDMFAPIGRAYRYLMWFGFWLIIAGWGYLLSVIVANHVFQNRHRYSISNWAIGFATFSLPAIALTIIFSSVVGGENHRYFYQITPYLLMVVLLTITTWWRVVRRLLANR